MLVAIIILSCFLAINSKYSELKNDFDTLTNKYNYTMGNLLNGKNKILEKQAGINSLYQDRCII